MHVLKCWYSVTFYINCHWYVAWQPTVRLKNCVTWFLILKSAVNWTSVFLNLKHVVDVCFLSVQIQRTRPSLCLRSWPVWTAAVTHGYTWFSADTSCTTSLTASPAAIGSTRASGKRTRTAAYAEPRCSPKSPTEAPHAARALGKSSIIPPNLTGRLRLGRDASGPWECDFIDRHFGETLAAAWRAAGSSVQTQTSGCWLSSRWVKILKLRRVHSVSLKHVSLKTKNRDASCHPVREL